MKPTSPSEPPPYWALLFGYIVVGVPFAVGVVDTVAAIQLSADTREVQGIIVDFKTGSSAKGGAVSKPVVEYHAAGQTHRCTGSVATNLPIYAVGDSVPVLYKVNEPSTAYINSFFDRWLCPLAFAVAGFGFLGVLVLATVKKIQYERAETRVAAGRSGARKAS